MRTNEAGVIEFDAVVDSVGNTQKTTVQSMVLGGDVKVLITQADSEGNEDNVLVSRQQFLELYPLLRNH